MKSDNVPELANFLKLGKLRVIFSVILLSSNNSTQYDIKTCSHNINVRIPEANQADGFDFLSQVLGYKQFNPGVLLL